MDSRRDRQPTEWQRSRVVDGRMRMGDGKDPLEYFFRIADGRPVQWSGWDGPALMREWDLQHPDGEGETSAGVVYQWVRVTDNAGKVLGTFFLKSVDDGCCAMFLATPRKGLPPNPFDRSELSEVPWLRRDVEEFNDPEVGGGQRVGGNPARPDDSRPFEVGEGGGLVPIDAKTMFDVLVRNEASKNAGVRVVSRVSALRTNDGDVQFRFNAGRDSFAVRGSKLAPVLFKFRQAGVQRVALQMVREALNRLA